MSSRNYEAAFEKKLQLEGKKMTNKERIREMIEGILSKAFGMIKAIPETEFIVITVSYGDDELKTITNADNEALQDICKSMMKQLSPVSF